ncbi:hypothetical protein [Pseudonocardia sp. 73-21]|uniref:hypothetical protein n=1 Tax=Pseudonocardia sp. 73-21 TaxID=1895809 RepID=UPI000966845A|nr:hypothetical protein [Pseudonocardia sp. 73-21]OJY53541.1 MAG: hypothetical protein BGP03_17555 [Pseudonocardia sp. 73-21]
MSVASWARHRRDRWADVALVDALVWSFREACIGAGVAQAVDAPIAGTGFRAPEITHVELGPPVRLTVRMPPGMVPAALRRAGPLVAPHLGGVALRVTDRGHGWALVDVLTVDPLADYVPLHLPRTGPAVLIGRGEDGLDITEDWRRGAHTIVQGVTRSGKSVWTYGALAQLAAQPDVLITGCDPTGLLWRPFAMSRHAGWQVSGLADLAAHEALLRRLVDEMDRRVRELPTDRDTIAVDLERPMLVVVLEEYPGLLRAVDAAEKDLGKRIRALVGRLLAEGAKVGIRVVILAQRAEAAVVGAFERAMCSLRISFRTDNRASVELLHPGTDVQVADAHTSAEPGIALMSAPGRELTRIRAPYLGGYPEYTAAIAGACA